MVNIYEVSFIKGSGGIKEPVELYYSALDIIDVIKEIEDVYNVSLLPEDNEGLNDIKRKQQFSLEGEWKDDISGGGDWMFFDLEIKIISNTPPNVDIIKLRGTE
ncbi:MAG: hypothetical protein PF570_05335 [Candidatus Cloacimonetes bacterium]|nr:hypothetical protein [Candidatus Cloacimonadota bacterium]